MSGLSKRGQWGCESSEQGTTPFLWLDTGSTLKELHTCSLICDLLRCWLCWQMRTGFNYGINVIQVSYDKSFEWSWLSHCIAKGESQVITPPWLNLWLIFSTSRQLRKMDDSRWTDSRCLGATFFSRHNIFTKEETYLWYAVYPSIFIVFFHFMSTVYEKCHTGHPKTPSRYRPDTPQTPQTQALLCLS